MGKTNNSSPSSNADQPARLMSEVASSRVSVCELVNEPHTLILCSFGSWTIISLSAAWMRVRGWNLSCLRSATATRSRDTNPRDRFKRRRVHEARFQWCATGANGESRTETQSCFPFSLVSEYSSLSLSLSPSRSHDDELTSRRAGERNKQRLALLVSHANRR